MRFLILTTVSIAALTLTAPAGFAADVAAPAAVPAAATVPARVEKIGVVDVQALISSSKAGKSIQAQIGKQRDSLKDEFSKIEKDLAASKQKLIDDKANQNTPEFAAKRKNFETKIMDANKLAQQKNQTLEHGANDAVMELRKAIIKVVANIAEKEHYTIVVTRDNVVLAENSMDITEKVMAQLDTELSDVKVKLDTKAPAKDAPAAAPAADKK